MIMEKKQGVMGYLVVAILTIISNIGALLFYNETGSSLVVGFIMLVYSLLTLGILRSRHNFADSILFLSILSIPTSFISIIGTSYATLPISWFVVCMVILSLLSIKTQKTIKSFLPLLIMAVYFMVSIIIHGIAQDSMKQIVNIMLYFLAIPVSYYFIHTHNLDHRLKTVSVAKSLYLASVLSYALAVIFQSLYIQATGDIIGTYDAFGGGRTSYASLFSDYSFASLFLASASVLAFYNIFNKKIGLSILLNGSLLIIFMYAILLTTARTGLLALAVVLFMILIYVFVKNRNASLRIAILFIIVFTAVLAYYLFSVVSDARGGQSLTDGSNRLEDYRVALNLFADNSLMGVGFGLVRYDEASSGVPIPHNFFIQYIVQGGIVGLTMIVGTISMIFINRRNYDKALVFMLVLIFIGSMFIPDVLHSRSILIITILVLISSIPKFYSKDLKGKTI